MTGGFAAIAKPGRLGSLGGTLGGQVLGVGHRR